MEKRIKDLTNIPSLGSVVSIPIDSTNFNKAMNIETTTLLKNTIDDADITNDYQVVTPSAIYDRYASETKVGLIKLYSDGDGDAPGSALTPNDINAAYDTFQIKKTYNSYITIRGVDWGGYTQPLITASINSTDFSNVECNITTVNIRTVLEIPYRNNSISFTINDIEENIPSGTLCSITGYAVDKGNRIAVAGYISNPLGYTPTFTIYATVGMFGQFSDNNPIPVYLTATYSTI